MAGGGSRVTRIDLAGGTFLTERHGGLFTWQPDERVVAVTIDGSTATLTTTDDPPERLAALEIVGKAAGRPADGGKVKGTAAETPATPKGRSEDAKRWDTLNDFEDYVARYLTPAEQAVWHYLFRWCRDGKVSASTRRVAAMIGVDPKTVTAALATLKKAKLLWEIAISSHRGEASVYGMNGRPVQTVKACEAIARSREGRRPRRPI
jgi:hypothetical protein